MELFDMNCPKCHGSSTFPDDDHPAGWGMARVTWKCYSCGHKFERVMEVA